MGNKMSVLLIAMGFAVLASASCKTGITAHSLKKNLKAADAIAVYTVDGYPTLPSDQKTGTYYLQGYAVGQQHILSADNLEAIKVALNDTATFDSNIVKSCPMIAQVAIDILQKGKSKATLILSPYPCGKALLFDPARSAAPVAMDLVIGNRLEPLLFDKAD
jgi:hypothetical protein